MRRLKKFLREEAGFTLSEMLVTMLIMITVLFALYSIFDMSIRVFSFGNDKVEAVENARQGLEKMERELRAAYPLDAANSRTYLFFSAADPLRRNDIPTTNPTNFPARALPTNTQVTFGNETNLIGNSKGRVDCTTNANCEYITYKLTANDSGAVCSTATCTLRRVKSANSADVGDAVVGFVDGVNGLTFTSLGNNGEPCGLANPTCNNTIESQVAGVLIELKIKVPGDPPRTQVLTTKVDLRNR